MAALPLMLHACCGPCSLEPVRLLREEGFEPVICWTNPNIQPVAEHDHRLRTLETWAHDVAHVDVVVAGDDREAWERLVAPHGFDRAARCRACYALRLSESCRVARERGFGYLSTTLAVSPYQLFDTWWTSLIAEKPSAMVLPAPRAASLAASAALARASLSCASSSSVSPSGPGSTWSQSCPSSCPRSVSSLSE